MAQVKLRRQRDVVARCRELSREVGSALAELPGGARDPAVVDAIWRGEDLGTLLWALDLLALPDYDEPFDHAAIVELPLAGAELRDEEEIDEAREAARLWHWRARTTLVRLDPTFELPRRWQSFDQLVAATAMRGHEEGLLPAPARGDFPAFGTAYRALSRDQHAEALSIAYERHRTLNWLCGLGQDWDDVPTDS